MLFIYSRRVFSLVIVKHTILPVKHDFQVVSDVKMFPVVSIMSADRVAPAALLPREFSTGRWVTVTFNQTGQLFIAVHDIRARCTPGNEKKMTGR